MRTPSLFISTLVSLLYLISLSTPGSALQLLVSPTTTTGANTTVYWVREPTDPTPLFDLRFVINADGSDQGLAMANIDFSVQSGNGDDGVKKLGKEVVQFPKSGQFVLKAVAGRITCSVSLSNPLCLTSEHGILIARVITLSSMPMPSTSTSPNPKPTDVSPTSRVASGPSNKTGIIVGATIAAILILAAILLVIILILRRRRAAEEERNRLSFHPDQMVQCRRSRWVSGLSMRAGAERFSISRGGGRPSPLAVGSGVGVGATQAGGDVEGAVNPFEDVEATAGNEEVVFDVDNRHSIVESVRTSKNSFSSASAERSRYSGDVEAAEGLARISEMEETPVSTKRLRRNMSIIPPMPIHPPPKAVVRDLPAIPTDPAFDEDVFTPRQSSIYYKRDSAESTTVANIKRKSALSTVTTPNLPPVAPLATPSRKASATPRTARPLPSPFARPGTPTTATLRSLPPLPETPMTAPTYPSMPRTPLPPVPRTPSLPSPAPRRDILTERQQVLHTRLGQVNAQLSLLRSKIETGSVDGMVGSRVEKDLEKQARLLEANMDSAWALGEVEEKPAGWERWMRP
ncbi:hypothetical protein D9611_012235 [Ephemerocybe angulata]|uniref:Uncharacterized protein n=1 Tax=Ephemerocybe angulata TaxID=980116 RepID=A0A8H5C6N5_9AGAR|nr:hypothetical protein D9611_012235 [Tulosesus angulatus]